MSAQKTGDIKKEAERGASRTREAKE